VRLLGAWGAARAGPGSGEVPPHEPCGTELQLRWWCPSCRELAETEGEETILVGARCDRGQGILFARPLAAETVEEFLIDPEPAATLPPGIRTNRLRSRRRSHRATAPPGAAGPGEPGARIRSSTESSSHDSEEAIVPARGTAEWKGDLPTGAGSFTAGDTISGEYSFKSRFEDGPGANPEQLIAAAHASCFSMALSNILAQAGTPPESVRTAATVTLRRVGDAPTITKIELATVARVPGIDQEAFERHANAAKADCPVSRALAAVPEITLDATLAG